MTLSVRQGFFKAVTERLRSYEDVFLIKGNALDLYLQRNFLSETACRDLIEVIDSDHRPATVLGQSDDPDYRTNESSPVGAHDSEAIRALEQKINEYVSIDAQYGECIEGQRYAIGQQFKPHHDFFHPDQAYWPSQEAVGGQRTWTAMICLNEPFAGGATMFPLAGVRIKPRVGNLLLWCNLSVDGSENHSSLHCGEPVVLGTKYILTKWYRERRFEPWKF